MKSGGRDANTAPVGCLSVLDRWFVGGVSGWRRVYVGGTYSGDMARPEVDDDILDMAAEIVDESVTVPLPSDDLSFNQQLRIIIGAIYSEVENAEDPKLIVDEHYMKDE